MLYEYVLKLLNEDDLEVFNIEYNIFYGLHNDDIELCDAYSIYRLFCYLDANDASTRINIIGKIQMLSETNINSGVLETVGVLIKKDTYEHQQCEDINILTKVYLVHSSYPLGYVSEEVMRCFTMHTDISDEDAESYIDSILQTFIKIFFLKTEEVRTVAIKNKMLLFNIIETIVMEDADLNLMVQIKEIGKIVLEWSDSYV